MAAHFELVLDTTAPAGVTVEINGGDAATSNADVTLAIATSDGDTTGYSMRIYGDVDDSHAPAEYRATESNAPWIGYATSKSVRLALGDGSKTIRIKVRDDVGNQSSEATDAISLDTAVPTINITDGPNVLKVSKVDGFDDCVFEFEADEAISEWTVRVVPTSGTSHTGGTQIPTAAGSSGVSGGSLAATTPQSVTINEADLEAASSGDGTKIVKVFGKASAGAGNWSI